MAMASEECAQLSDVRKKTPLMRRCRAARSRSESGTPRTPLRLLVENYAGSSSEVKTPVASKKAIDAVLEAVADVLLMEASVDLESRASESRSPETVPEQPREEPVAVPGPWKTTVIAMKVVDDDDFDSSWWACGVCGAHVDDDEPKQVESPHVVVFDLDVDDYDTKQHDTTTPQKQHFPDVAAQ